MELQSILPAVDELPPEAAEAAESLRESLGYLDSCIAERNTLEAQLKQISENVRPNSLGVLVLQTFINRGCMHRR